MNREEVKKILLEQFKKVPNREVCQVETENEITTIVEELEFDEVGKFLKDEGLNLTVAEVPKEFHFEMVLYFILMTEYTIYCIEDSEIWNLDDADTLKFIKNIRDILFEDEDVNVCFALVEDILDNIEQMDF